MGRTLGGVQSGKIGATSGPRSLSVRVDSVWDVRERLEENFRRVKALLSEMEMEQEPKMRLAAAAELRQHIALAERTLQAVCRAEAVRAFEDIVLAALADAEVSVRRRVIETLRARSEHGRDDCTLEVVQPQDGGPIRRGDAG